MFITTVCLIFDPNWIFQEFMLMRFYQVPVLLTQPTKKLDLVRQQIYLFVELIPHKMFPGD